MKKSPSKPVHLRQLDLGIREGCGRARGLDLVRCDVRWVYVEANPESLADHSFLAGHWKPGKAYRVHGIAHNLNAYRLDIVFLLADESGRFFHVHIDHTREAEED